MLQKKLRDTFKYQIKANGSKFPNGRRCIWRRLATKTGLEGFWDFEDSSFRNFLFTWLKPRPHISILV
ncbi:unnamed protein product [Lathyrus sativus]|nr:unnamed protein product [Lathyrus sativus]